MISTESGVVVSTRLQDENGCSMIVLTQPDPFIYNDLSIHAALSATFRDQDPTRYGLLSVPGLKFLPKNAELREQVVQDVLTGLDRHRAENLLVVTADHEHAPIVRRLRDEPRLRKRIKTIRGYTAKARRAATHLHTLAIACTSWRKHAASEFLPRFAGAFGGGDTIGVMTVPGAAKAFREGDHRGKLAIDLISRSLKKNLKSIVLVSHTDCGEYGGSRAFPDADTERVRLLFDLGAATTFVHDAFDGKIKVQCAIAHLSGDRLKRIEAIAD